MKNIFSLLSAKFARRMVDDFVKSSHCEIKIMIGEIERVQFSIFRI